MTCPSCGSVTPDGARFCPACGHTLVSRPDERRVVTVLFADLVGFTTFSEHSDPESVKQLVDTCFEALTADVAAHGGRLDKIVGDALIALFGAPVAHEDDAERAVRAALQMQSTLAGLRERHGLAAQLRVGVNSGEVLVGALRAGGDYTAMGDVVNTASRLQTAAGPGHVIVGPGTYAATRGVVRHEPLGVLPVRGRDQPVEAWRALEAMTLPGRRPRPTQAPLVGREPELALLDRVLDLAFGHGRSYFVLLVGEAGVGKSRLAHEVADCAVRERGARVLKGHCLPYGSTHEYWPLAEALNRACGVDRTDSIETARDTVRTAVLAAGLDDSDAEVERVVDGLLFVMRESEPDSAVEPARARDDALRATRRFFELLARQLPLVLVLSDLHWADEQLLDALHRLLIRLRALPFVVLGTVRPEVESVLVQQPGRNNTLVLTLDPLDEEATAAIASALLGQESTPEMVQLLLDRSGGNPFFIEELVALVQDADVGQLAAGGDERLQALPVTLRGLVAARLDALEPSERALLEDCAVLGSSGPIELVERLATDRADPNNLQLLRLSERDLIVLEHGMYSFKSELVREVAYGTLAKAERARRHAAVAAALESRGDELLDARAGHWRTAAELAREVGHVEGVPDDIIGRAIAALERSAEEAERTEHYRRSEESYDRALHLLPADFDATRRWELMLGRARARTAQRFLDDARVDADTVRHEAGLAGDARHEAAALTVIGDVQQKAGDHAASSITLHDAVARWRQIGDPGGTAEALRISGMTDMFRGAYDEAETEIGEARELYESLGDQRGQAWALQNLAWISFMRGDPTRADERVEASAHLFGEIGDWGGLSWALGLQGWVRFNQGRLDEARALTERIQPEAEDSGNRWAFAMSEVLLAQVSLWQGRAEEAVERGRRAHSVFAQLGDRWGQGQGMLSAARALAARGRRDEALDAVTRGAEFLVPEVHDPDLFQTFQANVLVATGESRDALTALESANAPGAKEGLSRDERRSVLALALLQCDRAAEARPIMEEFVATARSPGALTVSAAVLSLTLAAVGEPDAAIATADRVLETGGTYLDRMQATLARGFALGQRGRTREAAAAFDTAIAAVDATDARLDQALARLARAHALAASDDPAADAALAEARARLTSLRIAAPGWETAYSLAATGGDAFVGSPPGAL
jgi:class 3 adenylate cyclase/tetratricopeptide (TPR) repeat protein